MAGRAVQLVEWTRTHRFCGRCGTPTDEAPGERARRCPSCGLQAFPRLAPAIITLVERADGRALLARNARFPTAMYSCVAGFVEPGETLEEAVRREVFEEVGVRVGDMRYRRSQPWPFPHSLMLGFHADYESGDIACDGIEIADADWFAPDDLPDIPGPISIARWLIDDWLSRSA
ncbi:MAG: NAD(+) diphosphatase [Acidobacteria bacterium]|nr:NAD(+) diphosphatase [Acidobacteriota bacterium]